MVSKLPVKDKSDTNQYLKVAPFRKEIRKTEPHTHNSYFEIIFLSQGTGNHYIDSVQYEVAPPVIYFIRKEQVHHWELDTSPDGFVLIIKKAFADQSLDHELKNLISKVSNQPCLRLANSVTIHHLFELLVAENKPGNENSLFILEGLLKALLAKVLHVAQPFISYNSTKADLYQTFQALLNNDNKVKNSVIYYAGLLHTTPQNLNKACRRAVNQPAAAVLANFIIAEAKRLLVYTNTTVSGISFLLDFSDPSHFIKYFKRITGVTPKAFRAAL